jgi:hypothetical protein
LELLLQACVTESPCDGAGVGLLLLLVMACLVLLPVVCVFSNHK